MLLHSVTNIAEALAWDCSKDGLIKTLLRSLKQLLNFCTNFAHTECVAGVATETIKDGTTIDRYDITIFQWNIIGNAVYNNFVNRSTN